MWGFLFETRSFETFGTLLPAVIILTALSHDIWTSTDHLRFLKKAWHVFSCPFQNFMTLDDLLEPVGPAAKVSWSKIRVLVALSTLSSIGWFGCLAFGFYTNDTYFTMRSLIFSICWVINVVLSYNVSLLLPCSVILHSNSP